jgi:hypothetical protein
MAIVATNGLVKGFSGKFGNQIVFRQLRGKTIMARRSEPTKKQSIIQQENRSKFREATCFAKTMMRDVSKKEYYARVAKKLKLPNAYTAAITDFMRNPEIVNIRKSSGDEEWTLHITTAKKNFQVKEVFVEVIDESDEAIVVGKARCVHNNYYEFNHAKGGGKASYLITAVDYTNKRTERLITSG